MLRMIYVPNGKVVRFEPISGPQMLSASMQSQLSDWIVKTDATGDELCETLVIADFHLSDSIDHSQDATKVDIEPSIFRISAESETICLCDPDGTLSISWKNPFRHLVFAIKRGAAKLFGHRE